VVELNFLNPFSNLQVLNINTMNVDISKALQILYPYSENLFPDSAILLKHSGYLCANNESCSKSTISFSDNIKVFTQILCKYDIDISYNLLKYSGMKYLCMPYIDMFYQDQYITHPMALRRDFFHGCFHIKDRHYNFEELHYGLNTIEREFRDKPEVTFTLK
jgi:hypothetical protein